MEKESFSETGFSFPFINKKEKSTYYKTFYSGNPLKKQKTASTPRLNGNTLKLSKGRNRAFSSFGKYASQLRNNIYNKNKKNKLTTLFKNKNSFSSAETDDTFFALSEVRQMDRKIAKRINKGLIWKEKLNNIYDICTSQNKKDIDNVRKTVRLSLSGDNFDLRSEIDRKKYFPVENVDIINEAKDIMNNIKKVMSNDKKAYETFRCRNKLDLHTFVIQNRDICKKNFVIDLLKNERNKIKTKEKEVIKALDDANKIFISDKDAFDKFTQNKKRQFRETDLHLDEAIRNNKILMEQIKKYNSEVHGTENEIERNIKGIILYKSYADFIHKLLGKENINVDVKIIKNNLQNKEKDLVHTVKYVIKQFKFLLNSKEIPVKTEEINNPDLLTSLFFSLEGNIIQQMSIRDDVIKEKFKQKKDIDSQILSLQKKLEDDKKNLNILCKELEMEKVGYKKNDYQTIIDGASELIYEISDELNYNSFNQKGIRKPIDVVLEDIFAIIHKMEEDLYKYSNEMEKIQGDEKNPDELFKKIVEKIKLHNKAKKHQEGKEALLKLEEEKSLKYLQRMNRYKIRGPIVYPPPRVLKKKKTYFEKQKKVENNYEEMLYYN